MSLFASFTLVPLLASRWEGKGKSGGKWKNLEIKTEHFLEYQAKRLVDAVQWSLKNKTLVFITAFVLFAGSILLIPSGFIGIEFTKAGDRSEFLIELELEKTATLAKTNRVTQQVEKLLLSYPEVEAVFTSAGITSSGRIETNTSYLSEIFIRLNDKSKRNFSTSEFSRHIKKQILSTIPGIKVRPIELSIIGIRDDDAVQVSLQGLNRDSIAFPAQHVFRLLDSIPGSAEIQTTLEDGIESYEFVPDAGKMDLLGIDPMIAGLTLRTLINGNTDFTFKENNHESTINIIAGESFRTNIDDVAGYTVLNNQGKVISFSQFGQTKEITTKGTLERTNRSPSVTIKSQVIGRPAGTVTN
ncbi:MAG TPA: efflux RND transporter permease subunit, partial [Bacteroidia bacterium]|nr:efflux RND transporter permease subunit [Bacteroidia bacterium]